MHRVPGIYHDQYWLNAHLSSLVSFPFEAWYLSLSHFKKVVTMVKWLCLGFSSLCFVLFLKSKKLLLILSAFTR